MSSSAPLRSLHPSSARTPKPDAVLTPIRVPRKRTSEPREQVAAVCYRIRDSRLEFLLVQTRRGRRWTFPKGGVEPGLTRSQSAALEAQEEAGVCGSVEEAPFARYTIEDRGRKNLPRHKPTICAYLCAVAWLLDAHETKRHPTWCSPEKAKKRLAQDREPGFARELCRVVDRAAIRVERLQNCAFAAKDALRQSCLEAPPAAPYSGWQTISPGRNPQDLRNARPSAIVEVRALGSIRKILQLGAIPSSAHVIPISAEPDPLRAEATHRKVHSKKAQASTSS